VLSAGVFGFPWRRLAVTLFVARGLRYTAWAIGGVVYGDEALALLQRSDAWFARNLPYVLGVTAALVAGGVAFWLLRRRRPGMAESG
jgi:hypothetical protein